MSALADWLRDHGAAYSRNNPLSLGKRRALRAITTCRTPMRGGQAYRCTQCGRTHLVFHSCHHRACPRCGVDGKVRGVNALAVSCVVDTQIESS